jgi:hypothetical protein
LIRVLQPPVGIELGQSTATASHEPLVSRALKFEAPATVVPMKLRFCAAVAAKPWVVFSS